MARARAGRGEERRGNNGEGKRGRREENQYKTRTKQVTMRQDEDKTNKTAQKRKKPTDMNDEKKEQ